MVAVVASYDHALGSMVSLGHLSSVEDSQPGDHDVLNGLDHQPESHVLQNPSW